MHVDWMFCLGDPTWKAGYSLAQRMVARRELGKLVVTFSEWHVPLVSTCPGLIFICYGTVRLCWTNSWLRDTLELTSDQRYLPVRHCSSTKGFRQQFITIRGSISKRPYRSFYFVTLSSYATKRCHRVKAEYGGPEVLIIFACMLADAKRNRSVKAPTMSWPQSPIRASLEPLQIERTHELLIEQGTYVVTASMMEDYTVYYSGLHNPELLKSLSRS